MPVNLIKLCVGCDSLADLEQWQKQHLSNLRRKGLKPELVHITRQQPKRAEELLDGGSLYWVIKGLVTVRQKLLELRDVKKNGLPHCGLVCDQELIPVQMRPCRPFQGWRYLETDSSPRDMNLKNGISTLPENLQRELAGLGLL